MTTEAQEKAFKIWQELWEPYPEVEVNRGLSYYIFGVMMNRWEQMRSE
jgi:predicted metalloprotease with PDZ domain